MPFWFHSSICLLVSLLPVVAFLLVLIFLDSFKLVRFRSVLYTILVGAIVAFASLWLNSYLMQALEMDGKTFARYAAPVTEEILKGLIVVFLLRRKRIGFMVDASIYGFAVGAGFAIVENIYYFKHLSDPNILLWAIRGFGTAVMHGGVTATGGIIAKVVSDRYSSSRAIVFVPGIVVAIVTHSFFNHFVVSPVLSTMALTVILPLLIVIVFRASENSTREWLGMRMDTDAELLEMINTGKVTESRVGAYLLSLRSRFTGEVVADMLCLLRIHLELSIRAKGILLMNEAGFKTHPDEEVKARFEELRYLEKSVGKTGLLAISPLLHMSDHDLWQLHMLGGKL